MSKGKSTGKAPFKAVDKRLESLGYQFVRINSRNWHVYSRSGCPDVTLNPSIAERDARHLVIKVERSLGIEQETNKRNAQAIKDRNRIERDRIRHEMDRLDAERAELIRRKQLLPEGDFDGLARNERLALEREIHRIEGERREWLRLMTQTEATS